MAEAADTPQHRFFCHCCKSETNPKLPDFVCPRCDSDFIEEVTEDSSLLQNSTPVASEDSNAAFSEVCPYTWLLKMYTPLFLTLYLVSLSKLWQLLFMERSALLSHPPSSESEPEDSEQVSAGQSCPSSTEAGEPESPSQPEQERSPRPEQRPAVEGIVHQFLADLFANNGNPGAAPAALSSMLQLHSNPGDYAWGQGGLDAVITETADCSVQFVGRSIHQHDTCPVCRKSLDGVDNSPPPTSEPPEARSFRTEQQEKQAI
ncbi:E3 ubiquitin-protein ligase RNF115 isoform X4 [Cyclopterus lumpus]|uniref:E3 ubiquitin-protein ligase RNF115 isoform X4 n=1 Tax=Cyclopterus lumpus TaxID=8103 RepID=UPI0014867C28|nr:E3 ubiquitin-protein ligase RNF115 isoform X4 [Cyclopterus lumpus]